MGGFYHLPVHSHSSILAWKFHGQRSLAGYSPWVYKESDTLSTHAIFGFNDLINFHKVVAEVHSTTGPILINTVI